MPLTPEDVQNKLFSSVRYKRGYDEDEVDAFLDEVEHELTRLGAEVRRLTAELEQAQRPREGAAPAPSALAASRPVASVPPAVPPAPAIAPVAAVGPAAEASPTEEALRRTLVLAQRTADAAIAEARTEAEGIVAAAREKAAAAERAATVEHAQRQQALRGEHEALQASVRRLREFEREHRERIRAYLHLQLRELDNGGAAVPAIDGAPREAITAGGDRGAQPDGGQHGQHRGEEKTADASGTDGPQSAGRHADSGLAVAKLASLGDPVPPVPPATSRQPRVADDQE
ncbi:MAG TPA: DivIVA domain-containing protein [Mycobacteriales bacterium]|nr:DivIVA domain-containing protein [Mycobacteriales bacterium]